MTPKIPFAMVITARRLDVQATRHVLIVRIASQRMDLFERARHQHGDARFPRCEFRRRYVISTSRFGIGQQMHSNFTPLGLHRVARKIGGGWPLGTAFKHRRVIGCTWLGLPNAGIVHRILWLEGLEPGFNRGGDVDTFRRYIYLHGFGDELTLGRPQSHGCIHLAGADLLPLYDRLSTGTLVWIARN